MGVAVPTVRAWLPNTRAWLPNTRAWLPNTRAWLPNTRAWLPKTQARLPKTRAWLPKTRAWLPSTRAWLPRTNFIRKQIILANELTVSSSLAIVTCYWSTLYWLAPGRARTHGSLMLCCHLNARHLLAFSAASSSASILACSAWTLTCQLWASLTKPSHIGN